jgi:signal transduction histidine kinase
MTWRRHKRQFLLFLTAILLPAALLIGLAVRVIYQEAELAEARAADERRAGLDQARWELSARLEAIKLQEMNRRLRAAGPSGTETAVDPAVVLVTTLNGDRMVFPWEAGAKPTAPSSEFEKYRNDGELLEFRRRDLPEAIQVYRQALDSARRERDECESRLLLGRVFVKASQTDDATRTYRAMLKECGDAADQDGIPFRLYAAQRLIDARLDPAIAYESIVAQVNATRWRPPLQAYLMRALLSSAPDEAASHAYVSLTSQIHDMEQVLALARDVPKVRGAIESVIGTDSVWLPYGNEPWLVTVTPSSPSSAALVFIVSSRQVEPRGATLISGQANGSAWLGQGFLNLSVQWHPGRFRMHTQNIPLSLYAAGLALVLGMTILGGYLLLRDVNRDVRMAEMRSHFVANVSHELKTPLTAIRMFAETLVLGRSTDERMRSEYLQTITNESERLSRLVDNVLEFSQIEQGRKIYGMRTAILPEVVRSAARAMQYPLAQQGFHLNVSIDEEMPPLPGDPDALEQAILNLLTNAMKYSGDARAIDLSLAFSNGEAVITVTDRGLGIRPEERKRIFEKFYRVRSPETECIAGTGLGLTLVQHIAEAHRGRVEVQSTPGKGSSFSLRIPLETPEIQA